MNYSVNAERCVLSCILQDETILPIVESWFVDINPFYFPNHKKLYDAMREMKRNNEPIDFSTVVERYKEEDLTEIMMASPSTVNYEFHLKEVQMKYAARMLKEVLKNAEKDAEEDNVEEAIDYTMQKVRAIQIYIPSTTLSIEDVAKKLVKEMETGMSRIRTGFKPMDMASGGVTRKEMLSIGSRPSHGKTVTAINLAQTVDVKKRVMFISFEMPLVEIFRRQLPVFTNITYTELVQNEDIIHERRADIETGVRLMAEEYPNIKYGYRPKSIQQVELEIHRYEPEIVIVDHLHKIPFYPEYARDPRLRYNLILEDFHQLGIDNNFGLIMLFQLNREIENRIEKKPRMSDAKETGLIEELSENVFMLYRDYVYNPKTADPYKITLINCKSRFGKTFETDIGFDGEYQQLFETPELAKKEGKKRGRTGKLNY